MNERTYPLTFEKQRTSNLYQNLATQYINQYGIDIYYIPVELTSELEDILGELKKRIYHKVYGMRMYLEDMQTIGGSDVFSKFGLQVNDEITLWISRAEFLERTTGIPKSEVLKICDGTLDPYDNTYRDKLRDPKQGDLIWTPMWNSLWEITYGEHQDNIVLGFRGFWKIICKKYTVSATETIHIPTGDTGESGIQEVINIINEVDDNAKDVKDDFDETLESEEVPKLNNTGDRQDIFGDWN